MLDLLMAFSLLDLPTYYPVEVTGRNEEEVIRQIQLRVEETRAQYVLVGRTSIGQRGFSLVREAALPEFLEVVRSDEEIMLLRVVGMELEWFDTASDKLEPDSSGSIQLEIRLRPNAPLSRIRWVVMVARDPNGIATSVPMEQVADGLYRATVSTNPLEPGEWHLTPAGWDGDRICRGETMLLIIR